MPEVTHHTHALRVLQVLPHLIAGGVERGTLEIAKALRKNGAAAFVCSGGGKLVHDLENSGVRHITLPVYSKNPLQMIINIFWIYRIIKKHNINIVHARSRAPAWSCFFACKLSGVKFVTTFHGTYKISNRLKLFYNSIMLKGEKVIAVSHFIYHHIVANYKVDAQKIEIIHRGVDLNYFSPKKVSKQRVTQLKQLLALDNKMLHGKKIIIMPARFTRWKGHLYLLNILKYSQNIPFLCILSGTTSAKHRDYFSEIESTIKQYQLQDKVLLKPEVQDMPALYMLSDIVISPSLEPEAFGRTITEGQSMGKIVIATNKGGASEASIVDKVTGFHIPSNNAKVASEIMLSVLKLESAEYATIADASLNNVKNHFSLETMCSKTIRLYESLI